VIIHLLQTPVPNLYRQHLPRAKANEGITRHRVELETPEHSKGDKFPTMIAYSNSKCGSCVGTANVHVVPSGPGETSDGLLQMLLGLINAAQQELVLTTPYLVPDDAMIVALRGAAGRGVEVTLIVPEKIDSFLTRYASRSYYDDLLKVGVAIELYRGGLLHTKSISVDQAMSMFGTVNLDMRSRVAELRSGALHLPARVHRRIAHPAAILHRAVSPARISPLGRPLALPGRLSR
jgi:phosphatidylserine/phosphatidylglycerophosphate/cardiolipin synthase-like enzyme